VLLRELFLREATAPVDDSMEKYGRPFNHPEHLVFFKGSNGTIEALNHFKEIATEEEGNTTLEASGTVTLRYIGVEKLLMVR